MDMIEASRCCVCNRNLLSEAVSSEVVEGMSICGHCKFLFLEDTDTNTLTQHTSPTTSYNNSSPESIENILSQEFPDMINLSRHNQIVDHLHTSSRQWRRVLSDTESEQGFDSDYEETDVSSYENYDTYADPIHDDISDDGDDEDRHESLVSGARLHRSFATNGRNRPLDWLREAGIGIGDRNGIDDVDETERWVGPPPASASFVKSLEGVIIGDDVEGLVCVICKEGLCVGSVVNRLPCLHVYHGSCIIPWLNTHNTCPLCRYNLPTDTDCERPNRNQAVILQSENVSGGGGGGGGWWWFVVAPVVSMVGIGLMLWLGRGGSWGSRRWCSLL